MGSPATVFRRAIDVLRPGLLAGVRHVDDLHDEENIEMKDITPPKDGNSGLDGFAATGQPTETMVEPCKATEADKPAETSAEPAPEPEPEKKPQEDDDNAVTIWASADEPERKIKSISNAVFVVRGLIKDARTPALAKAVFDQNMAIIAKAGKDSGDSLEAELKRKMEKGKAGDASDDGQLI